MTHMADTIVACATEWSHKGSGAAEAKITVWAAALRLSVLTHQQDLDWLMPWAHLLPPELQADTEIAALLQSPLTLTTLPKRCKALSRIVANRGQGASREDLAPLMKALETSASAARSVVDRLIAIADLCKAMFDRMEFGFLFDSFRQLLSIGYREADGSLDDNFYDLLASEARLASFVAIAKGDLPAKHWFRLGRTMTPIDGSSGLISWSGSMFEYLMPSLVMRAPAGSLLAHTNRLIVWRQEKYGAELGVPWGMSESEYDLRDIEKTYQYSSFGVPDSAISAAWPITPSSRPMPADWRR